MRRHTSSTSLTVLYIHSVQLCYVSLFVVRLFLLFRCHFIFVFSRAENNEDDTFEVRFRSKQTSGLLAWLAEGSVGAGVSPNGGGASGGSIAGSFVALALADGHLEFNLHLAATMRRPLVLRSQANVNDGRWHHAKVQASNNNNNNK